MRYLLPIILVLLLIPVNSEAQTQVRLTSLGSTRHLVTRADLQETLEWHETILNSNPSDRDLREQAEAIVQLIQGRLEEGDFRPGDQIWLSLEGEAAFPDTLVVETGPAVLLPDMGVVSLRGVLRSELQEHLETEFRRFLRNPVLRVQPTIRLTFEGAIGRPGFYTFPAGLPIGDAIMQAGGPGANANMEKITVRRGPEVIVDAETVQLAVANGQSFDQLGLQPGDQVNVATETAIWGRVLRYGVMVASVTLLGVRLYGGFW